MAWRVALVLSLDQSPGEEDILVPRMPLRKNAFPYQGRRMLPQFRGGEKLDEPNPLKDPSLFTRQADCFANCILNTKPKMYVQEELTRTILIVQRFIKLAGLVLGNL